MHNTHEWNCSHEGERPFESKRQSKSAEAQQDIPPPCVASGGKNIQTEIMVVWDGPPSTPIPTPAPTANLESVGLIPLASSGSTAWERLRYYAKVRVCGILNVRYYTHIR